MTDSVVRRRRTSSALSAHSRSRAYSTCASTSGSAVAERLERARGDHLVRERAVRAGQVRGEQRVELRMPPPQSVGRDVGVGGARQRPRPAVDPVQLELGAERVQHRQRDAAVRRQLAAGDRDHPERAGRQHRLAVRARRRRPLPPAGRGRRRSGRARRRAHRARARARPRRGSAAPRPSVGSIARASPSKAESVVPSRSIPAQGTANATRVRSIGIVSAAPQPPSRSSTRCAPLLRVTEVPARASSSRRTSSIHGPAAFTTARAATSSVSPESVSRTCATGPRSSPTSSTRLSDDGAGVGRAAQVREAEPRVVGLGVRIETGGAEAVEPQRRDELRRGGGRDHAAALGDGARQARVRPERAADRDPPVRAAAVDREHEVERPDEVRRDEPAERAHLGQRLADEAEVAEAQVAEPAVDRASTTRSRCPRRSRRARRGRR